MSGNVKLITPSNGSVTLSTPDTASAVTVTIPATTDTLVNLASTQTLSGKTLSSPTISGTATGGTYASASITAANSNTVEATSGPTITQLAGNRNKIINGRMEINQRGVTSGITSGYFVDRWAVSGVSTSSLITSSLPTGYTQAISVNRTSAPGTAVAYQRIESVNCFDLVGASATVSFWAQNVTGLSSITVTLSYATAVDNFSSVTSINTVTVSSSPSASWTYYTATFSSLPASAANGLQLAINGTTASTGTLGVTGVQLEKGATATPFENRLYGTELALCQRYYEQSNAALAAASLYGDSSPIYQVGWNYSGPNGVGGYSFFKAVKRATPSMVFYTSIAASSSTPNYISVYQAGWVAYPAGNAGTSTTGTCVYWTGGSTGSCLLNYGWTANAEL